MVWKRGQGILWIAAVLLFSMSGTASDPDPLGHGCQPVHEENLMPYGSKASAGFLSPGLHGSRLVYHIDNLYTAQGQGHVYELEAVNPLGAGVPDFDIVFVTPSGNDRQAAFGDQTGVVPGTATEAYVYMPVGPDGNVAPGNPSTAAMGEFRFTQC